MMMHILSEFRKGKTIQGRGFKILLHVKESNEGSPVFRTKLIPFAFTQIMQDELRKGAQLFRGFHGDACINNRVLLLWITPSEKYECLCVVYFVMRPPLDEWTCET